MKYIPSHLQIEPVNRFCDARCPMCTIKFVPDWEKDVNDELSFKGVGRKAEIMSLDTFKAIVSKFTPYVKGINILSLHGCGESLLDKGLYKKIAFAKEMGFKEVGFTSNCNILTRRTAENLLDAGLNCIIPSIDGTTKDVHEAIRPRTNFEQIVENVKYFIEYRNRRDLQCKVLIRMVRQQLNSSQWDDYNAFWKPLLNQEKGDDVLAIDVHNNGGKVIDFHKMKVSEFEKLNADYETGYVKAIDDKALQQAIEWNPGGQEYIQLSGAQLEHAGVCPDLFSRLSIFVSGDVALCSADQAAFFRLGNVIESDPIEIFNGEIFTQYRDKWLNRQSMSLEHCKGCSVTQSRFHKSYLK
jgi:MoaA/NifB/PqqE/SkfB family radical SAM enzyme